MALSSVNESHSDWDVDEQPVGNWMMEYDFDSRVKNRIACEERNYPASEALYASVEDWEKATGQDWDDFLNP